MLGQGVAVAAGELRCQGVRVLAQGGVQPRDAPQREPVEASLVAAELEVYFERFARGRVAEEGEGPFPALPCRCHSLTRSSATPFGSAISAA